jgi:hypothetical protein
MATHYIEEFDTEAKFLAASPDRHKKLGIGSVSEVAFINKGGAAVELIDETATQTLSNKTLTTPSILFPVTEYDADGAIAIATGVVVLTSADAGAYTLAAPTAGEKGTMLFIFSRTAAAHVITATNLINDGVGPTLDTITFDAQPGAHIILVADNLLWYVLSQNATTATAGA